jgi:TRAP-type mannitol/chloroaromatic compound transport system permease small subunit
MFLEKMEAIINRFSDALGKFTAVLFILLLLNVFIDVIMRYLFNDVSIGMQEMEWHLYASIFMLSIPYALYKEGHVRVDIIYDNLTIRKQAWIDLFGTLILLLPFSILVTKYGIDFTIESYKLGEGSGDPGGLPYRWIIKSVIPITFLSIGISGIGLILKSIITLRHPDAPLKKEKHTGAAPL